MSKQIKYFLLGALILTVVDYTTAFNPQFSRWVGYMPEIWLVYLGWPAFFGYLIYRRSWHPRKVFIASMGLGFSFEVILFHNIALITPPAVFILLPVFVSIYSLITFSPWWIIEKKLFDHRRIALLMILAWVVVSILSFKTRV